MRCFLLVLLLACGGKPPAGRLELVEAPAAGAIAPIVVAEQERAAKDGKRLIVYVEASWCEPCRRFHEAAQSGALDESFGNVRLLMFDSDRDMDALHQAGYIYANIPMFALPGANGI